MRGAALAVIAVAIALAAASSATAARAEGSGPVVRDTYSDTWVATDALGRQTPLSPAVRAPRRDRYVAVFYFLWLGPHVNGGPYDVSRILAQDPGAMQKPDSPLWGPMYAPHHWGQSLFGYYLTDDRYVLRRHAQMLSDAGVDAIVFDASNQLTYRPQYTALLDVFAEVRRAGGKTPQVAFLCPFWDPAKVVHELYRELYAPGIHPELWFRWEGKPLILADPERLYVGAGTDAQDTPTPLDAGHTLGQSFTADKPFVAVGGRFPTWNTTGGAVALTLRRGGPTGEAVARRLVANVEDNAWLYVETTAPQPSGAYYLEASAPKGKVGWWTESRDVLAGGEAYSDGKPVAGDRTLRIVPGETSLAQIRSFFTFRRPQADYFQGPTGPNQWSWLEVFPQHVFRNARGEKEQISVGVAQNAVGGRLGSMSEPGSRGRSFHAGREDQRPNAVAYGLNAKEQWERAIEEDPRLVFVTGWNEWIAGRFPEFAGVRQPVMFVDEFDEEHSRDIEPMKGGHGDSYYYQLVSFVRRFKGARALPVASPARTIRLAGPFSQWTGVRPEYRDDAGDAAHRDHPGWNNVVRYRNSTGRNDFVSLKVARDPENVYFYAQTLEPISPHTDPHWMMLYIDVDGRRDTGWEGYDYVVNRLPAGADTCVLEAWDGMAWRRKAVVRYTVRGNELMLAIPRAALGLHDAPIHLDFKWADNMQRDDDVNEFTLNGDSAPNGRFNYRYRE